MKKYKMTKQKAVRYAIFVGLAILAIFFIMPYFWMLSNSFKSTQEILVNPRHLLPLEPTLSGYAKVLTQSPFFTWFKNSAFITVTNTIIILFTSALVGYVFSKFHFKHKNLLFAVLLASMMVPAQTTMIPSFLLINFLGLYNTAGALIFPSFVNAFGIYLCKQFCDEIPKELIESAKLDGAGDFILTSTGL